MATLAELLTKLEELQDRADALWSKACEHDKISEHEMFVVFSDHNPYWADYNKASIEAMDFRRKLTETFALV